MLRFDDMNNFFRLLSPDIICFALRFPQAPAFFPDIMVRFDARPSVVSWFDGLEDAKTSSINVEISTVCSEASDS